MSDVHVDITEALEAGTAPKDIAKAFGISLDLVEGVVPPRAVSEKLGS